MEQLIQHEMRKRDLSAYEPRVRLRVSVRPSAQVVEGHVVPQGTHLIEVPTSKVGAVMSLVETAEDRQALELAERAHQRELQKWQDKGNAPDSYFGSVEREFHKIAGKSVPPLTGCEVLARDLPPALTDDEHKQAGVVANMLATLVKAGVIKPDAVNVASEADHKPSKGGR